MKVCPICKSEFAGGEVFCPVDGSRLSSPSQMQPGPDPSDPLIGTTLNQRYHIIRQIGEGGMGIVYEAMHVVIEKKVALKVLRDDFSKRTDVVERFRQEAKSASRIGHEHIVDISDFGETPSGQSYFVMEFLEGEDLADLLAREGTMSPSRAALLTIQCCRALGAAHAKGIVHRDMKPENIFLVQREGREDFVKIVDFGIAKMSDIETDGSPGRKLTKTGMIFGTPEYMSPEQAAGKPLDHRVDIYALGVILYELLTGRVPFIGDTFMGVLTQHMFEDAPSLLAINPHVRCPEPLERVIYRAITKDPDRRYSTMDEFGAALATAMDMSAQFRTGEPTMMGVAADTAALPRGPRIIEAEAAPELPVPQKESRRSVTILAVLALLLAAGAGGYFGLRPATGSAGTGQQAVGPPPLTGEAPAASNTPTEGANAPGEAPNGSELAGQPGVSGEGPTEAVEGAESPPGERPSQVTVHVATTPPGARIMVAGHTVCEPSPCEFDAEAGQSIRIRARRGRAAAVRDLRPDEAISVEMVLERRGPRAEQVADGMQTGMIVHTDLKIPEAFR